MNNSLIEEEKKVDYLVTNLVNRFAANGILISSLDLSTEESYVTGWKGGFHTYRLQSADYVQLTEKDIDKIIERGVTEFNYSVNPALDVSDTIKQRSDFIVSFVNRIHAEKWMIGYLCAWCQDNVCSMCKHLNWLDIQLIRYRGQKKSYAEFFVASPVPNYETAVHLANRVIDQIKELNNAYKSDKNVD